jgi:tRNA G18 (ribose-2'-O)-methylase SpoU
VHPERGIYILGNETVGLPQEILSRCNNIVKIPTSFSLNVAIAGSIVLYDRMLQRRCKGTRSIKLCPVKTKETT